LLQTGTIVAGYRVDGDLGEGGMGVVYRATQLSLDRVVALKVLSQQLSADEGFRLRFQREGQLQASLDHPHIVTVYEAGQTDQGLFLAMRLIEGPTLKDLILDGQLDPRRALRLLAQVAQALDSAHELGLIHRDIKPQNILIGRGDHAYLADFGLIKSPDDAGLTGTGQFIGTIDYVAPEQIQGEPASAASDIYALAGVLCESLTGQVPFPKPNEAATVHAHVMDPPPKVTDRRPELPAALDDVIASGLAKDPSARPASASELIRSASLAFATANPMSSLANLQEARLTPATGAADRPQATLVPGAAPTLRSPAAAVAGAAGATRASGGPAPATAAPPAAAPAKERSTAARVAMIAVPLAVVAIVAGFLVGGSGKSDNSASTLPNRATVGHLRVDYPAGWALGAASTRIPGITFQNPMVLSPAPSSAALQAGDVADAAGPTLLSPAFRAKLVGALPAATAVRLGALQAYRYSGLHVRGLDGTLTVYAVPTTTGVVTLACWTASSGVPRTFPAQCGDVAATAALVGSSPYPLGVSAAYATTLSNTFKNLGTAISGPLARLRAAKTPAAQSSAASSLSTAYGLAASGLSSAKATPEVATANAAIVAALNKLSHGYSDAASASSANSSSAYGRASKEIAAASAALHSALASLAAQGYKVGS
jgi:hypothetical protein